MLSDAKIGSQIKGLINSLYADGQRDIICESDNVSVVLPTYDNYFVNNNMNELTDGKYKFLGKVVQMFADKGEISLLRNTAFSKLNMERIKEFENIFNDDSLNQYMKGNISTSIKAPVIMVIPIAIYV